MAEFNRDQGSGYRREDVYLIVAFLLFVLRAARNLLGRQPFFPRGGVPGYQFVGNNETWKDLDGALALPSALVDLRISPNIDPEGQYNVRLAVDQPPAMQEPMQNIDADNVAAAEAELELLLAVAEVASLPRQIERDEANMIVRRPHVPSSVTESGVGPSSLVDDVAARAAPQNLPPQSLVPEAVAADATDVLGILPRVLLQRIEDKEAHAEAQVEVAVEVEVEDSPPGMLELISDVARLPQFAAPSMIVPAGGLESNLEERMPVDHPEAGDSSPDFEAEVNIQDDENLEVEEPHAKGMQ